MSRNASWEFAQPSSEVLSADLFPRDTSTAKTVSLTVRSTFECSSSILPYGIEYSTIREMRGSSMEPFEPLTHNQVSPERCHTAQRLLTGPLKRSGALINWQRA